MTADQHNLADKKILIIKLRYIGDTLSILPVIENLRAKVPAVTVDVMVNRGTEPVIALHPGIRRIWVYDRACAKKNIKTSLSYHKNLIRKMRVEQYDYVVDFTQGDRAAFLAFMTGAPIRITYKHGGSTFSSLLMNRSIKSDPLLRHIIDHQLESLTFFGLDGFDRTVRIHVPDDVINEVDRRLLDAGLMGGDVRVAIHPGARGMLRRWRPERFAEIARRLQEKRGAAIILLGGAGEGDLVDRVETAMDSPAAFRSTSLGLLELAALLKTCRLFIGNDTAPGHIAAAVGCPTLTLFGPTFPHMWRPVGSKGSVLFKNVPCCGCRQETCVRPDNTCMDLIGVEEVWEEADAMLAK